MRKKCRRIGSVIGFTFDKEEAESYDLILGAIYDIEITPILTEDGKEK